MIKLQRFVDSLENAYNSALIDRKLKNCWQHRKQRDEGEEKDEKAGKKEIV